MTTMDKTYWEQLWEKTLREHGDKVARKPPNAQLIEIAGALPPARALDAGCGHCAESLWLASHGWQVTAVDFAAAALAQGRSMAASI
ncbi:MAG TPA: methyltransferase domain-containing protein, partial [Polyangiales bacterium]|nr:methyltransferase domain-containing protein [Polyangiales bacterium]